MQSTQPIRQDVVLIGGGHSHAIALKKFGMNPLPGVRLTLITDVSHTPYSGMLPGYVAGLYDFDECHIDLRPLTQFAQVRMIHDRAIGLDLQTNQVICANHPQVGFDLLSIDIGSTPSVAQIPGAKEYAIPVKPISGFLAFWDRLVAEIAAAPDKPLRLGIVGGGTGGVELALNVQARLYQIYQDAQQSVNHLEVHLFHRGRELLEGRSREVRRQMQKILVERGIVLHLSEAVAEVEPDRVICESGLIVKCDRLLWVTQAAASSWLRESGLTTDSQGFVQINRFLQSVSHPHVFAAGDVATMVDHPRPKAGVFAVRQGKPLFQNLRHALLGQPLRSFVPQKEFLILVGMGDRTAVASRGPLSFGPSPLIWQWKDQIDRKFMSQFADLKPMMGVRSQESGARSQESKLALSSILHPSSFSPMRCMGCGAKVGSSILERSLRRVRQEQGDWGEREDILIGLDAPDDAAVVRVPADQVMVQTVDYFPALVNDPFLFGQISTNHCLSDIFAMGAAPQSAMAIATLPYALEAKTEEMLYQLLSGAVKVLRSAGAVLIGGHTTEGQDLAFGLSCNGLAYRDRLLRKGNMQPGQVLILTKALGTGTLFAADMRLQAKGRWIESAVQSMLLSNQAAAECFQAFQASACTDITGFGLLGHLMEMVRASRVSVSLSLEAVPILDGVKECLQQEIFSSLYPQNLKIAQQIENLAQVTHPLYPILFDPQTSGGLLAAVPQEQAIACLSQLHANGYPQSAIIGRTFPLQSTSPPIAIAP